MGLWISGERRGRGPRLGVWVYGEGKRGPFGIMGFMFALGE